MNFLSLLASIQFIVAGVYSLQWDSSPSAIVLGEGVGVSSRILIQSPHCCLIKCKHKQFLWLKYTVSSGTILVLCHLLFQTLHPQGCHPWNPQGRHLKTPALLLPLKKRFILSAYPTANTSPSGTCLLPTSVIYEIPSESTLPGPTPSWLTPLAPSEDPPGKTGPVTLLTPNLLVSATTSTNFKRPIEYYSMVHYSIIVASLVHPIALPMLLWHYKSTLFGPLIPHMSPLLLVQQ